MGIDRNSEVEIGFFMPFEIVKITINTVDQESIPLPNIFVNPLRPPPINQ